MGKRILLADDSVTIQKVVELTFMDEDYEVVAVSNGDEAVARLADLQPDLVIADVHMPGQSGYDVCRRAKQWRAGTPVLLLVGTFEPFQETEANAAGADGFLKKPFDSQELLRRVDELLQAAASAPAPAILTPADEMETWEASAEPEEEGGGELWSGSVVEEEHPAGPLGQSVPDEMVLEASPWTEAEEVASPAPAPAPSNWWSSPAPAPAAAVAPAPPPAAPVPAAAPAAMPPAAAPPVSVAVSSAAAAPSTNGSALSDADVDRIARRVVELIGDQLVREVAWEVVPDMAELVIKDRLRELERQLEGP